MGIIQDVIRRITVQGKSEGLEQLEVKLREVGAAQGAVAVASEKTERSTLSLQTRINGLQKSLDAEYRAEQQLVRIHKDLDAARAQGLITAQRQNELATLAAAKYRVEGESAKRAAEGLKLLKEVSLGFVGGIGAGVLLGSLTELPTMITEVVDKLGHIGDVAQTIGVSTKALQELRFAASQTNVDVGTLDDAMAKFSTNLAKNGGPLQKEFALNNVKITGDVLKDLETYADLIKNATNQEQRNVLVATAFGKSAQEVGRLFDEGSAGIARWADQADRANAVRTDEQIKRAADLDAKLKSIIPSLQSTQQEFALLVAPAEIAGLQLLNEGLKHMDEYIANIANNVGPIVKFLTSTGVSVGGVGWNVLGGPLSPTGTSGAGAAPVDPRASAMSDLRGQLSGGRNQVDVAGLYAGIPGIKGPKATVVIDPDAETKAAAAENAYAKLIDSSEKRVLQLHNEADALAAAGLAADTMRNYSDLLNQAEQAGVKMSPERVAKLYEEADALAKAQEALAGAQLNNADLSPIEVMGKQVDSLSEKLDHGVISWRTYNIEIGKAAEQMAQSYGDAANDVIGNLDALTTAIAGQGREAFEIHKALSIAKAVVSGGEAIVHSYTAGTTIGGPIVGAIFAGIAAAATAAQVAAIASTTYQSKTIKAPSAGGSGARAAGSGAAAAQSSPTINLTIRGSGSINIDDMVDQLTKGIADGGHQSLIKVIKAA